LTFVANSAARQLLAGGAAGRQLVHGFEQLFCEPSVKPASNSLKRKTRKKEGESSTSTAVASNQFRTTLKIFGGDFTRETQAIFQSQQNSSKTLVSGHFHELQHRLSPNFFLGAFGANQSRRTAKPNCARQRVKLIFPTGCQVAQARN
jgi:hypothetical protein